MSEKTFIPENKAMFIEFLKKLPESVFITDKNYKIIFVNDAFLKIYNAVEDDIIGKPLQDVIDNTSKINCHICKGTSTKFIPEENYSHQATLTDSTGKDILIRISHSIADSGNYFISTFSPMSDLVCLNQAQIDFVSTVSHELRTPMTSIKGFADTLLNSGDKLDDEQKTRFLSIIKSQADRLTRLVENLLTVSRLEIKRHKSDFKAVNLLQFIDRVFFSLKSKYPNHKFKIKANEKYYPVWADQDKLEQILTNLIDNAAKYSYEGSTVTVQVRFHAEDTDKIEIRVIDQGVGIPEKYLPKIFNKFSRIDNPLTRQVQGTGLGLYITKALAESMGGKIKVKSNEDGTTFTVTLLVATPERQAKQGISED